MLTFPRRKEDSKMGSPGGSLTRRPPPRHSPPSPKPPKGTRQRPQRTHRDTAGTSPDPKGHIRDTKRTPFSPPARTTQKPITPAKGGTLCITPPPTNPQHPFSPAPQCQCNATQPRLLHFRIHHPASAR